LLIAELAADTDGSAAALIGAEEVAEAQNHVLHVRRAKKALLQTLLKSLATGENAISNARRYKLISELSAIERYEQRALSRRQRAIRSLVPLLVR